MVLCFKLCVWRSFFVNLTETKYGIEHNEFLKSCWNEKLL